MSIGRLLANPVKHAFTLIREVKGNDADEKKGKEITSCFRPPKSWQTYQASAWNASAPCITTTITVIFRFASLPHPVTKADFGPCRSQSEHLMPRPVHAVGQIASHFRIAPPGLTFDSARMNDLVDQMAFHEYIEATKKRERELTKNGPCVSPIADALDSYGSQLFRGLNDYTQHDRRTNKEWFRSFWYMYWERNRSMKPILQEHIERPAQKDMY